MSLIVIDPGHGGQDPGAVASGLQEKDLNLAISREMMDLIQKNGFPAGLTRTEDAFLSLQQRCEIANNLRATLFLSIHCNGSPVQSASGIEVYYNDGSDDGKKFARALHKELSRLGRNDRGVKPAEYYVLKHTHMPACLVECGFITNREEAVWLKDHISEIAQALARSVGGFGA